MWPHLKAMVCMECALDQNRREEDMRKGMTYKQVVYLDSSRVKEGRQCIVAMSERIRHIVPTVSAWCGKCRRVVLLMDGSQGQCDYCDLLIDCIVRKDHVEKMMPQNLSYITEEQPSMHKLYADFCEDSNRKNYNPRGGGQ